jgi:hypothetical protein
LGDWKSVWQEKTRGGWRVFDVFDLTGTDRNGHTMCVVHEAWCGLYYPDGRHCPAGENWADLLPVPRPPKMRPMTHAELVKLAATPGLLIKNASGTIRNHMCFSEQEGGKAYENETYSLDAGATWHKFEVQE